MVVSGYLVFIPLIYFWRAVKNSRYGQTFYYSDRSVTKGIISREMVTRLFLVMIGDVISNEALPLLLYGTKDLDLMPDFLIKRVFFSLYLATLAVGPIDSAVVRIFRGKKKSI